LKEEEDRDFYRKLGSPIRREIVRLLGERGQMGATELNESVNISAGRFYYHLDFLGDLVTRDKNKKYVLTERGKLAYQMLMGDNFSHINQKDSSVGGNILSIIAPDLIINYISKSKVSAIPFAVFILAITILVQNICHQQPRLLFITASSESSILLNSVLFIINFAIIFAFLVLVSYAFGKRKGNLELFAGVALSQIPLIIFSLLSSWFNINPVKDLFGMAVFTIFELWTMLILIVVLSRAKKMSYIASGLTVFCLAYITNQFTHYLVFLTDSRNLELVQNRSGSILKQWISKRLYTKRKLLGGVNGL